MSKNNKGIDYSKWDHLDYGSSSDDDDEKDDEQHNSTPRVTRLDQPSCITRTSQGEIIVQEQQQQRVPPTASSSPAKPQQQQESIGSSSIPTSWTEKGSTETINGHKIYWCQDRYTVTIRIMLLSSDTTTAAGSSWYCKCTNVLPYDQRYSAVLSSSTTTTSSSSSLLPHLTVGQRQRRRRGAGGDGDGGGDGRSDNVILLESDIPYPIHADEGDDNGIDNTIDWSIETYLDDQNQSNKYMIILLKKATPVMGMTLWWKKLLVISGENEINVDWTENSSNSNKFAESWKIAHEQFRKNREREQQQQQQQH